VYWKFDYGGRRIGYTNEADLFADYCPEADGIYIMSVADAAIGITQLRVDEAVKAHSSIRRASEYELRQNLHNGPVV
jgi:hypothetical protein